VPDFDVKNPAREGNAPYDVYAETVFVTSREALPESLEVCRFRLRCRKGPSKRTVRWNAAVDSPPYALSERGRRPSEESGKSERSA